MWRQRARYLSSESKPVFHACLAWQDIHSRMRHYLVRLGKNRLGGQALRLGLEHRRLGHRRLNRREKPVFCYLLSLLKYRGPNIQWQSSIVHVGGATINWSMCLAHASFISKYCWKILKNWWIPPSMIPPNTFDQLLNQAGHSFKLVHWKLTD